MEDLLPVERPEAQCEIDKLESLDRALAEFFGRQGSEMFIG